jgi:hypothetical protein
LDLVGALNCQSSSSESRLAFLFCGGDIVGPFDFVQRTCYFETPLKPNISFAATRRSNACFSYHDPLFSFLSQTRNTAF